MDLQRGSHNLTQVKVFCFRLLFVEAQGLTRDLTQPDEPTLLSPYPLDPIRISWLIFGDVEEVGESF
jgi:hypothetical protein